MGEIDIPTAGTVTCYHRRRTGVFYVVFADEQVRDTTVNLADFASRTMQRMAAERLDRLAAEIPYGTPSWSLPLTYAFLADIGAAASEWIRYRLNEARARKVTAI